MAQPRAALPGGERPKARPGGGGFAAVAVVVYAGVGGLIAAWVPGNAIGWLLTLEGLLLAVSMFLEQYSLRGLATAPASLGVLPRNGLYSDLLGVGRLIAVIAALLTLASVFVQRRGASAELRQQLAWLAYVGGLTAGFGVLMIVYVLATHGGNTWLGSIVFVLVFGTPIFGIPLACAVAVLRYRLYDLDVVVKKTVAAAVVAPVAQDLPSPELVAC